MRRRIDLSIPANLAVHDIAMQINREHAATDAATLRAYLDEDIPRFEDEVPWSIPDLEPFRRTHLVDEPEQLIMNLAGSIQDWTREKLTALQTHLSQTRHCFNCPKALLQFLPAGSVPADVMLDFGGGARSKSKSRTIICDSIELRFQLEPDSRLLVESHARFGREDSRIFRGLILMRDQTTVASFLIGANSTSVCDWNGPKSLDNLEQIEFEAADG